MDAFISMTGVTKRFGARTVLDRVTLSVPRNERLVLVGPSGCGKTTLLRLIAGLERPDEGEITLEGATVSTPGRVVVPAHQRRLGFVFQDLALWPHLTVSGHLDFVLGSGGVPKGERRERIRETLSLVRVDSLGDRYPHQLSGGEQQRVALARAVVARPTLLLLDEPFSSLDAALRLALRSELLELHRSLALTLILVTHDQEEARSLATRVVRVSDGRLA